MAPARRRWAAAAGVALAACGVAGPAALLAPRPAPAAAARGAGRASPVRRGASASEGTFTLRAPDRRVLSAVEELGGRVTVADVLSRGVPASGLQRQLLELARATGATLQVNDRGELLFEFPRDFRRELRSRSVAARLQQVWDKSAPWLGYAGRVLFGVSLLATVAMLYSAVLILMSTSTERDRSGNGGGGRVVSQSNFSMWFGQDMFAWLMPRPYGYRYYGFGMYGYSYPRGPPPKMSFFESVFSFVFGDGDPNASIGETRWRLLAESIVENGGAVIAEQLAPFLDPPADLLLARDEAARRRALDRAVLPVLLRFRGEARVSDTGDIVYVFPELQESSAATALLLQDASDSELRRRLRESGRPSRAAGRAELLADWRAAERALAAERREAPAFLRERPLQFSQAEDGQLTMCLGYGAFSLLATLYLGANIASGKAQILARYYPVMSLVVRGFPLLLAYSCTFLSVPLLRWRRLRRANREIAARNEWRDEQAKRLRATAGDVARRSSLGISARIKAAARWAWKRAPFGGAAFDSSRSALEQSPARDLDDFDRRLRDS